MNWAAFFGVISFASILGGFLSIPITIYSGRKFGDDLRCIALFVVGVFSLALTLGLST